MSKVEKDGQEESTQKKYQQWKSFLLCVAYYDSDDDDDDYERWKIIARARAIFRVRESTAQGPKGNNTGRG